MYLPRERHVNFSLILALCQRRFASQPCQTRSSLALLSRCRLSLSKLTACQFAVSRTEANARMRFGARPNSQFNSPTVATVTNVASVINFALREFFLCLDARVRAKRDARSSSRSATRVNAPTRARPTYDSCRRGIMKRNLAEMAGMISD